MTRQTSDEGFTLTEMLVVLAIIALTVALSAPVFRSDAQEVRTYARELASLFRQTRSTSMLRGTHAELAYDSSRRIWSSPGGSSEVPTGLTIELETAAHLVGDPVSRFRFYADGGSSGGKVILGDGRMTRVIAINWMNGAAVISEAPP